MDEFPLSARMGDREAVAILNRLRAANARADRLEAEVAKLGAENARLRAEKEGGASCPP